VAEVEAEVEAVANEVVAEVEAEVEAVANEVVAEVEAEVEAVVRTIRTWAMFPMNSGTEVILECKM